MPLPETPSEVLVYVVVIIGLGLIFLFLIRGLCSIPALEELAAC
jgi:hypothetical protein